ncbi:hypothetical protein NKJ06_27665 [Mesorhizobium sp. M0293]
MRIGEEKSQPAVALRRTRQRPLAMGKQKPIADSSTEAGCSANRGTTIE